MCDRGFTCSNQNLLATKSSLQPSATGRRPVADLLATTLQPPCDHPKFWSQGGRRPVASYVWPGLKINIPPSFTFFVLDCFVKAFKHKFRRALWCFDVMNCSMKLVILSLITLLNPRLCFYQTRSAWSMDQGSNKNHSPINNFTPTVTKFCVMWEGQALPHDTKFGNGRDKIVDSRAFLSWSLIHGSSWSLLLKAEPAHHGSTLIPVWVCNYIHHKVWDKITEPLLNFNGAAVKVCEWISSHTLLGVWLLIHAGLRLTYICKRDPFYQFGGGCEINRLASIKKDSIHLTTGLMIMTLISILSIWPVSFVSSISAKTIVYISLNFTPCKGYWEIGFSWETASLWS